MFCFSLCFFMLRNFFSASLCLCLSCSGIVAQSKKKTLILKLDYRLINSSVRQSENSIFFLKICVCICLYSLHCSCFFFFFYHHLLYLFLLSCPYLHSAHVYVLTNQSVALSHHESGCCSGCVKSEGQQRKAICLLRLRAKLFFLKNTKKKEKKKSNMTR